MKPHIIIIFAAIELSFAAFGNHDLFTSLAQLKQLWINERTVIKHIQNLAVKLESANYEVHATNILKE